MQIIVKGLSFVGKHGVYEEERRDGRRFVVDVVLTYNHDTLDDENLDSTLDYRKVADVVLKHGMGPSVQLIETLVDRILFDLLDLSAAVLAADVTICKHATGVPGDPDVVGVREVRHRP